MKKTMIYITDEQHEALRKLSYETQKSMSDHIRQALEAYLKDK